MTVSWKSPGDPVTGYVICYQSEGGGNSSDMVSGGETESHSLDCLESGVIYIQHLHSGSVTTSTQSTSWTCHCYPRSLTHSLFDMYLYWFFINLVYFIVHTTCTSTSNSVISVTSSTIINTPIATSWISSMNSMSLPETSGGVIKTSGSGSFESVISHFSVSTSHIFNTVTIEASSSGPSSTTTVSSNAITVPAIGTTYTQLSNIDISGVITPSSYPPGKKYVAI